MDEPVDRRVCRCGTHLARDNHGALCAACTKAASGHVGMPPLVPLQFWQHPPMRKALASWHMGHVIRAFRLHPWHGRTITQTTAATWLRISQSQLSREIENGPPATDLTKLIDWARILGIPPELLWFKLPEAPHELVATGQRPVPVPDDLQRLASDAAAQSLAFATSAARLTTDGDTLEHLRWELSRIAVEYVHAPLGSIFRDLVSTRDEVFALLAQRQRPDYARELYFLGGLACLLLAHASQNAGNQRAALAQVRAAWTCADVAGHNALRAWSKGTAALINEWTWHQSVAVELANQGKQFPSSRQSRIRLAAIEARAAARMGDRSRAHMVLNQLHEAQATSDDQDDVTDFGGLLTFPDAKQHYYIGSTLGLIGEHEAAEQHALTAIRAYETGPPAERSYGDEALARLDVVNARIALGDLDGASAAAVAVVELPPERRIRQLHTGIDRTRALLLNSTAPGARALLDQFADFRTSGGVALPFPR